MKRLLVLLVAVFVLSGCRNQTPPAVDPFFGRTRVPPPGTGSIYRGPSDPYYRTPPSYSGSPPATSRVPSGPQAQPPASSGDRQYVPPNGSFKYRGSSASNLSPSGASRPETRVPPPSFADGAPGRASSGTATLANRERVIRILQPRPKAVASAKDAEVPRSTVTSAEREPGRLDLPAQAVDIMDLPRAGESASATGAESSSASSGFRLVSGTGAPGDSASPPEAVGSSTGGSDREAAEFKPQASYGRDPEYGWLRGKLEYSQIDSRWKLRYIPVDGKTDEFGGSVVLPDATVLSGCQRGDFVEVHGRLGLRDPKKGYAPTYEVAEIQRLGP